MYNTINYYILFLILFLLILSGCAGKGKFKEGEEGRFIYEEGYSLYKKRQYNDAIEMFEKVVQDYPLGPYATESALLIADSHYYNKKYKEALSVYEDFVKLHPAHSKAPYALYQKGMSSFKEILPADRDQYATKKALHTFQELISSYPESVYSKKAKELTIKCKKRLAERELYIASFYIKTENYKGALMRLKGIINEYPEIDINDKVLFHIGLAYMGLGEKEQARESFTTLLSRYPDNEFADKIRELIEIEDELKEGK